jgi:hypothetical protein
MQLFCPFQIVDEAEKNLVEGTKLLNYPKCTKNSNLDAHVCVFKQAIKVNGITQEGTKIVYF